MTRPTARALRAAEELWRDPDLADMLRGEIAEVIDEECNLPALERCRAALEDLMAWVTNHRAGEAIARGRDYDPDNDLVTHEARAALAEVKKSGKKGI